MVWGFEPNRLSLPFDPILFDPVGSCTDTGHVWLYWIEDLSLPSLTVDMQNFKIAVDGINNMINVEALSGGLGAATYPYRVNYIAPDGFTGFFDFTVKILGSTLEYSEYSVPTCPSNCDTGPMQVGVPTSESSYTLSAPALVTTAF